MLNLSHRTTSKGKQVSFKNCYKAYLPSCTQLEVTVGCPEANNREDSMRFELSNMGFRYLGREDKSYFEHCIWFLSSGIPKYIFMIYSSINKNLNNLFFLCSRSVFSPFVITQICLKQQVYNLPQQNHKPNSTQVKTLSSV